jgi:hypothetical protein
MKKKCWEENVKKVLILFFILCFFGSSISCQKKPIYSATGGNTTPSANWTVMFYMGGTNNLEEVLESEINLLEKIGSNPKFNIVVQMSRESEGGKATRYYIKKDDNLNKISSEPIEVGKVDSADSKVLKDFIIWSETTYPGNQLALVVSSHGGGWLGIVEDSVQQSFMSGIDLQKAVREARFETGRKLDVLDFYSCLMGMTEVLYEFKDEAHIIVASEISSYSYTNFETAFSPLASQPGIGRVEFSKLLVKSFIEGWKNPPPGIPQRPQILAAFNMLKMEPLKEKIDIFTNALIQIYPWYGDLIKENAIKSPPVEEGGVYASYTDLKYFVNLIDNDLSIQDKRVKESAKELLQVLDQFVLAREVSPGYVLDNPNLLDLNKACGLTIWIPLEKFPPELYNNYSKLDFAHYTSWISFLNALNPDNANAFLLPRYEISQWKLFSTKEYSVNLPNNNFFKALLDKNNLVFFQGNFEAKQGQVRFYGGYAEMGIRITEKVADSDVQIWAKQMEARTVPSYTGYQNISRSTVKIQDQNAMMIVGGGVDKFGENMQESHIYLLQNNIGYDIYFLAERPVFTELLDIYLQIAKSFKLL